MKFIETSAKNATNVEEAFLTMTKEIVNLKKSQPQMRDEILGLERDNSRLKDLLEKESLLREEIEKLDQKISVSESQYNEYKKHYQYYNVEQ